MLRAARCWVSPWKELAELKLGQYIHRKRVPGSENMHRPGARREVLGQAHTTRKRGTAFQLQRTLPAPYLLAFLSLVLLLEAPPPGLTHLAPVGLPYYFTKAPLSPLTTRAGYMVPILIVSWWRVSPLSVYGVMERKAGTE